MEMHMRFTYEGALLIALMIFSMGKTGHGTWMKLLFWYVPGRFLARPQ
jgi:hypothetical protein